jgi:hypothetical protein
LPITTPISPFIKRENTQPQNLSNFNVVSYIPSPKECSHDHLVTTGDHTWNSIASAGLIEDEVIANEFESVSISQQKSYGSEENIQIEEEKGKLPQNLPRESNIGNIGEGTFSLKVNLSGLARSKFVRRKSKPEKNNSNGTKVSLKESKSPNPFEATYKRTESELGDLITTTSSPENPLYHLRQSGKNSPAIQKAYRHFVISLFESIFFVQKMKPFTEEQITSKKISLTYPKSLSSNNLHIDTIANKTLVLDLDETLVHCVNDGESADVHLAIILPQGDLNIVFYIKVA